MPNAFIEFAIQGGVLWLSSTETRKLKSGRLSPFFFNSGSFSNGADISMLGKAYAQALVGSGISFDTVFGPAYKGIPLAVSTAAALFEQHGIKADFAFNRKEAKDHGEGGNLVGASLAGKRVIIIDDVVTRGDAKREAADFIRAHGGEPVGIVIAFDRQEKGLESDLSGAQEVERDLGIPLIAIATTDDLIGYLTEKDTHRAELAAIKKYQTEYGVKN